MKPLHADWIVNLRNHMQGECETIVKGFKKLVLLRPSKIQKLFTKELKTRLRRYTFFRRLHKYCFMFEAKKMENKADVLVQLNSYRNLFYNPSLTSLSLFTVQENRIIFT